MLEWGKLDWLHEPGSVIPGTIIYISNIGDGILEEVVKLLEALGLRVRTYTGVTATTERKIVLGRHAGGRGRCRRRHRAIAAGVDGFQYCAHRLIILISP